MNSIRTIADFKRALIVGTHWEAYHKYLGEHPTEQKSLGIRTVAVNRGIGFGFETDRRTISYCDWPKKAEFSTEDGGNVVVITEPGFFELRYIQRH